MTQRPPNKIAIIGAGGVGATMRLKFGSFWGPAREIHSGSGYWSQDGAIQVLGLREAPSELSVRWPGGVTSIVAVPPRATEITASYSIAGKGN